MIAPANAALRSLETAPQNATLAQARTVLNSFANALATLSSALEAGKWPSADQKDVDALRTAVEAEHVAMVALAAQPSTSAIQSHATAVEKALAATGSAQAVLEAKLGV